MIGGITRHLAAAAAAALLTAGAATPAAAAPGDVTCRYVLQATYRGGFHADIVLTNTGPTVDGWTVAWSFPVDTRVVAVWQSRIAQPDLRTAVAVNSAWNPVLATGRSLTFGWTAAAPSADIPTDLTFNGVAC
jgi:hypothetical protein